MPLQLFLHMCDCGIQADAVTCCSLINAMDRAGLWQVAELVLLALCARMPSFRDMRTLPSLDLSTFLDAPECTLVRTLCQRLSGSEDGVWPDTASDTASPLSRLGTLCPTYAHAAPVMASTAKPVWYRISTATPVSVCFCIQVLTAARGGIPLQHFAELKHEQTGILATGQALPLRPCMHIS